MGNNEEMDDKIIKPTALVGREFMLVRHGESEANAHHVFAGGVDDVTLENGEVLKVCLSNKGVNDADILKKIILKLPHLPEAIIRSDLMRTEQTIAPALAVWQGSKPKQIVLEGLRERMWGELSGKGGDVYNVPDHPDRQNPTGGETAVAFANRSNAALQQAMVDGGRYPLVVGHMGNINSLFLAYGAKPQYTTADRKPPNAQIFKFTPKPSRINIAGDFPWDVCLIGLDENERIVETPLKIQTKENSQALL